MFDVIVLSCPQQKLVGTVKPDVPFGAKRAYNAMADICVELWNLNSKHATRQNVQTVDVKGPQYRHFENERNSLLKP